MPCRIHAFLPTVYGFPSRVKVVHIDYALAVPIVQKVGIRHVELRGIPQPTYNHHIVRPGIANSVQASLHPRGVVRVSAFGYLPPVFPDIPRYVMRFIVHIKENIGTVCVPLANRLPELNGVVVRQIMLTNILAPIIHVVPMEIQNNIGPVLCRLRDRGIHKLVIRLHLRPRTIRRLPKPAILAKRKPDNVSMPLLRHHVYRLQHVVALGHPLHAAYIDAVQGNNLSRAVLNLQAVYLKRQWSRMQCARKQ